MSDTQKRWVFHNCHIIEIDYHGTRDGNGYFICPFSAQRINWEHTETFKTREALIDRNIYDAQASIEHEQMRLEFFQKMKNPEPELSLWDQLQNESKPSLEDRVQRLEDLLDDSRR